MDLKFVDAAIQSQFFWSYLYMVARLSSVVEHLFHWADGCPCHPMCEAEDVLKRTGVKCPMQGRKAPELAAGRLLEIVAELFHHSHAHLVLTGCRGLTPAGQSIILFDFEGARHYMAFVVSMKTACFSQPPLIFAGAQPLI